MAPAQPTKLGSVALLSALAAVGASRPPEMALGMPSIEPLPRIGLRGKAASTGVQASVRRPGNHTANHFPSCTPEQRSASWAVRAEHDETKPQRADGR